MLKITEILPNPKSTDKGNEWIEITNFSQTPLNLANFTLDDSEKGSKPFTLTQTIPPHSTLLLSDTQTSISLNNKEDQVRLFNIQGTLVDSLHYTDSQSGKSYALTDIKSQSNTNQLWMWTTPTPDRLNPPKLKFTGEITTPPSIQDNYTFTFQPDQSSKTIQITFDETLLDFETSAITFTPQTKAQLLTEKPTTTQTFHLIDYKITEPSQPSSILRTNSPPPASPQKPTSTLTIILILIPLLAIAFFYNLKIRNKSL